MLGRLSSILVVVLVLLSLAEGAEKKLTKCSLYGREGPCDAMIAEWPDHGDYVPTASLKEAEYNAKYQRPRNIQVHGLTAKPWHSAEELGFAQLLYDRHEQIRDELLQLMALQTYGGVFPIDGQKLSEFNYWKLYHFAYNGRTCDDNFEAAPITVKTLKEIDAMTNGLFNMTLGLSTFSILEPSAHIQQHNGPNNLRIRCHLGLVTPPHAYLRVGDEIRSWEKGKTFCFDDSFEHEAWNNDTTVRAILMFDIWHYDFTPKHIEVLMKAFPATTTEGCGSIALVGFAKVIQILWYYLSRLCIAIVIVLAGWCYIHSPKKQKTTTATATTTTAKTTTTATPSTTKEKEGDKTKAQGVSSSNKTAKAD